MSEIKIFHIVGARPQFIKYTAIYRAITNDNVPNEMKHILIHTGQHYDFLMSDIFFQEFKIPLPDYNLGVGSDEHGKQTAKMIEGIEELILKYNPSLVVVYGDTNTTLAGALAAVKQHVPIAHVEAGLRSFNKKMPEEINRVLTDHCSTLLFCPSKTAVNNLKREGFERVIQNGELISEGESVIDLDADASFPIVVNVGDVMYDVLLWSLEVASSSDVIKRLGLKEKQYNVLTIHRAENTDNPEKFRELLNFVSNTTNGRITIFSVHPRTKKLLDLMDDEIQQCIKPIEPLSYFDMLWLVKNSNLIFTDSGGLQKEAYWLKVPCVTLREQTEWVETIESGWNVLYKNFTGEHTIKNNSADMNVYGDGKASKRIVKIISEFVLQKR